MTAIPVLSLLIWLPVLSGLILLTMQKFPVILQRILALLTALASLALCGYLYQHFNAANVLMQFKEFYPWLPDTGVNYALGIDGLSLLLCGLTVFMTFLVILAMPAKLTSSANYLAAFLIMQGFICGIFCSTDAILFYVFFEAMLIPMFIIIGVWGGENRKYAAIKFFLYTFLGSIFLLLSIIYLHIKVRTQGVYPLELSFMFDAMQRLRLSQVEQNWLFWGMLLAFAVKVPMWPVHTWLPDAHTEAPTGGSVILAAITLKVGGYGILRLLLPIVPLACVNFAHIIIALSLVAIIYIGFVAIVQQDMKRLIAYSSIAHMGFVTLGLFLVFALQKSITAATLGVEGAIVQMFSHGLVSGALFFCVGVLYDRMHSRSISSYGGVAKSMPLFATFFMIFALSNVGLPGTSGFIGELFVILTAFKVNLWYAVAAAMTLILGAAYTLWLYRQVMLGPIINKQIASLRDLRLQEILVLVPLALLIIIVGVWPDPVLNLLHAGTSHTLGLAFR